MANKYNKSKDNRVVEVYKKAKCNSSRYKYEEKETYSAIFVVAYTLRT